jgi:hypothetical protein
MLRDMNKFGLVLENSSLPENSKCTDNRRPPTSSTTAINLCRLNTCSFSRMSRQDEAELDEEEKVDTRTLALSWDASSLAASP